MRGKEQGQKTEWVYLKPDTKYDRLRLSVHYIYIYKSIGRVIVLTKSKPSETLYSTSPVAQLVLIFEPVTYMHPVRISLLPSTTRIKDKKLSTPYS